MAEFSESLQKKINHLKERVSPIQLGKIHFSSPLIFAPLAGISNTSFRLLMQELGAGGAVTEMISCYGVNYKNKKTTDMLTISPLEKSTGIQLFGNNAECIGDACKIAEEYNPNFIDINMGCPVKKVAGNGGGSALMEDTSILGNFFNTIKGATDLPITIKIRTGTDSTKLNAKEIVEIATKEGIELVTIHGRTKAQGYSGEVNWQYIEEIASNSQIPIIGNGDLNTREVIATKLNDTSCNALMLGRGPLRDPFLFLRPFGEVNFAPSDYLEVINRLHYLYGQEKLLARIIDIQMKKHIVWFASGFKGNKPFRDTVFKTQSLDDVLKLTEEFFLS